MKPKKNFSKISSGIETPALDTSFFEIKSKGLKKQKLKSLKKNKPKKIRLDKVGNNISLSIIHQNIRKSIQDLSKIAIFNKSFEL